VLFRKSLSGRFALDIMRTLLQTAVAAEVDLAAYLTWVMRMPADAVKDDPGEFTPLAFAQWCQDHGEQPDVAEEVSVVASRALAAV
jgi:hypothetical protein